MNSHNIHSVLNFPPPPPPSSSSNTNFPILAMSLLGILTTAILLLSYYIFVIKCCINWNRFDVIQRLSRRHQHIHDHVSVSVYATDIDSRGLDESAIQAIPTFRFDGKEKNSFHECAVCLNDFQEEERIRMLPNCSHIFHIDCIDTWLQTHVNCPLCRSDITSFPVALSRLNLHPIENNVVIDIRDEGSDRTTRTESNSNTNHCVSKMDKKLHKVSSMGDECIDMRVKDVHFNIQPMRRSFSMDSSSDRQLYMAVQEILRQNPHFREAGNGEESSTSSSSFGRNRRSLFSFSHCRSSRTAIPIQNEI